ncbi:MAG: hypothetical protein OXK79_07910 [Chloroflexota bacterium]|nr:hypothetical protein [Chloroflexota bacterium]
MNEKAFKRAGPSGPLISFGRPRGPMGRPAQELLHRTGSASIRSRRASTTSDAALATSPACCPADVVGIDHSAARVGVRYPVADALSSGWPWRLAAGRDAIAALLQLVHSLLNHRSR